MSYEKISVLKKRLGNDIYNFEKILYANNNGEEYINDSRESYKKKIDITLALQYQANMIVNISYNIMVELRGLVKKGGSEIGNNKSAYEATKVCLEHYRSQVYNFSQRLSVLKEMLKIKIMANPELN